MKAASMSGTDPVLWAALASILMSQYYFFVKGERMRGIFVGLWPPTIFALSGYFKQTRMDDALQSAMGKGGLTTKVQRMVQEASK